MAEKPLVLVIDDEKEVADNLAEFINNSGRYQAFPAYSAREGFEALKKNKRLIKDAQPGLILLDIKMPGKDGLQFLEELRKSYHDEQIGVIMVTAYEDDEKWDRATSGFVAGYLKKPIVKEDLLAAIDRFFSGERARANMTLDTFEKHLEKREEFKQETSK